MRYCFFDTETYSTVDLIRCGVYRYSEKAEIMLAAYAFGLDGAVTVWDCTDDSPMPDDLADAFDDPDCMFVIHNAQFDRVVMRAAWGIEIPSARVLCTMTRARQHALPGGLAALCNVFGIDPDQGKKSDGKALIRLFCIPQKKGPIKRATRQTHPREWQQFIDYAHNDITAMQALVPLMPDWNENPAERTLFALDAAINDRGFQIDTELVEAAIECAQAEKNRLADKTEQVTEGAVQSATQRAAMLAYFHEQGERFPDMRAATLKRRFEDHDVSDHVKQLISLRLQSSMTSIAKFDVLARSVSSDGRLKGTTQFCGAARTGRWSGKLFQPQNLARTPKHLSKRIAEAVDYLKARVPEAFQDNVMELISACARGAIIAKPGCKLVVCDLSNIEGRVLAWLAGEQWKLDAFHAFDNGVGHDLYVIGYARSFGETIETVLKDTEDGGSMRLIGKVQELACGYQGAVGAFATMAAVYPDLQLVDNSHVLRIIDYMQRQGYPEQDIDYEVIASRLLERFVLPIVRAWRKANPNIVQFWYDLEDAARATVLTGRETAAGKITFDKKANWLRMRLPSGRYLSYPAPKVDSAGKLTFLGNNPYTRRFERLTTYGGKLAENATQATSRDVFAAPMPRIDAAGYRIVLHIHDELVTETPDSDEFNRKALAAAMVDLPPWADGLPVAAAGYEAYRYRKG